MELIAALCFQLSPTSGEVDGWYRLIPAPGADGLVRGNDGRTWRMTDPQAVVAAFNRPLPVDVNHAEELKAASGEAVPAYAWVEEVQARDDGIYGRIAFNEAGMAAVRNREYRFLSPVFSYEKASREIRRLDSASLVNTPNFALALNRRGHANPDSQDDDMSLLDQLRPKLGLDENADEAAAVNAVDKLTGDLETARNRPNDTPRLDKFVPRADYDQAVETARNAEQKLAERETADNEAKIETAINGALAAGKITPATADYHRAQCRAEGGLDRFEKFVESAPVIADPSKLDDKPRTPKAGEGLDDEQRAVCHALGMDEADFAKNLAADTEAHG